MAKLMLYTCAFFSAGYKRCAIRTKSANYTLKRKKKKKKKKNLPFNLINKVFQARQGGNENDKIISLQVWFSSGTYLLKDHPEL